MGFSSFVAQRYFRSRKKNSAVGIITAVATFGVAVSVFAMFVVLSVFSGLREMNVDYLTAFDADLSVTPVQGKVFPADSATMARIRSVGGVEAASGVLQEKVFAAYGQAESVAWIKGVDASFPQVVDVDTVLTGGQWLPAVENPDTAWCVPGVSLISKLIQGASSSSQPLRLYVPSGRENLTLHPEALFSHLDTWPCGVFVHKDYDGAYIFTDIALARRLLRRTAHQVSSVEIRTDGTAPAGKVAAALRETLGADFVVKTAAQNQEMQYKIMNTENLVLYFVFALVIAIALFNVVGSVVMLILDKKENIRTLWALGADKSTLKSVFIREGMLIVGAGTVVGLVLAVILVWMQDTYHLVLIDRRLPYPVSLTWANAATVIGTILLLGYLAARLSVAGMKNFFRH